MKTLGFNTQIIYWNGIPFSFIPVILSELGIKNGVDVTMNQLVACFASTSAFEAYVEYAAKIHKSFRPKIIISSKPHLPKTMLLEFKPPKAA